jgi:hypothetical protein
MVWLRASDSVAGVHVFSLNDKSSVSMTNEPNTGALVRVADAAGSGRVEIGGGSSLYGLTLFDDDRNETFSTTTMGKNSEPTMSLRWKKSGALWRAPLK